jgi:hypothetical protein
MVLILMPLLQVALFVLSLNPVYAFGFVICLIAAIAISAYLSCKELCPGCARSTSSLGEGQFWHGPYLSSEVCFCPYCGLDLDSTCTTKDQKPNKPALDNP